MKDKLMKLPYWVFDLLSLISAILTIVTAIVAGFRAVISIQEVEEGIYNISVNKILVYICILFGLCIIVCGIKIKKYGSLVRNMRHEFANNYYLFLHDFRNVYFDILASHKNMIGQNKKIRIEALTKDTVTFIEKALDYLCCIMEKNTGQKVCACIKLIENTGNVTNIDKDKATVITFCRSNNTDKNRKSNDEKKNKSISVKGNTDFYDILDEDSQNTNSFFYQTDLLQYDKDLKKIGKRYHNTTEDFDKYYRGTIVVPIRVQKKRLHYVPEDNGYDMIGFLCIDSLSTNAFRDTDSDRENYSSIVKSFAAEMYIILNKYNFYLRQINGGK